jgi:hypothetical protein
VASVVVPVIFAVFLVIVYAISTVTVLSSQGDIVLSTRIEWGLLRFAILVALTALAVGAPFLASRGRNKLAVIACLAGMACLVLGVTDVPPSGGASVLVFALEAAALALSPGPARGTQLMRARTWAAACCIGVVLAALVLVRPQQPDLPRLDSWLVVGAVLIVAMAAAAILLLTIPSPVAKRLLVLLAIPAYPGALGIAGSRVNLAVAVLAAAAVVVSWRPRTWTGGAEDRRGAIT